MKPRSIATLLVVCFLASLMLTAVSVLVHLGQHGDDIRMEDLAAGHLGAMFAGPTFWSCYPSFPPPTSLIDYPAVCLFGSLFAASFYVVRIKLRKSLTAVSIVTLAIGAVLYALGVFALHYDPVEIDQSGPWLAVMLLGVLYASATSAALVTWNAARQNRDAASFDSRSSWLQSH